MKKLFIISLVTFLLLFISCTPDEIQTNTPTAQAVDPTTVKPPTGG